jgi:hypothetical protein
LTFHRFIPFTILAQSAYIILEGEVKMNDQISNSPPSDPHLRQKPNILFIMVDQQRYPVIYENEELRSWRKEYLNAETILKTKGMEFKNHYAGSTACCPSRATLYTGQYPSLHGVTETDGAAKGAYDANPRIMQIRVRLDRLLLEQCRKKRLYPTSGDVPGKPSCS